MVSSRVDIVPPWLDNSGPENDVVISTRIRLARNLDGRRFPGLASLFEKKTIYEEITGAIGQIEDYKSCPSVNFCSLPEINRQFLVEERIVSPEFLHCEGDRGVIQIDSHRVTVLVNEEDHLRMLGMDSGYRPDELWDTLDELDNKVGRKLTFAFDSQRGFLTSCPTNSGTGLRVSFLLHLPGLVLTKTIDQILQAASQTGISTRGFFGEHSEVYGSFFQFSNHATLGASEENFLANTKKMIEEIIDHERKARKKIVRYAKDELIDKIYRAYGIFSFARIMTVDEFFNLASIIRFGIYSNLINIVSIGELNRLMLMVLPAHIQMAAGKILSPEKLCRQRATLVKTYLGGRT
ncbi:MAG: ATP--guanido phosphotransferase [Chitinivibrionales bacterium]|nr:ATP--guanido phosphotransferase [Chitinivibrionales bacterium]